MHSRDGYCCSPLGQSAFLRRLYIVYPSIRRMSEQAIHFLDFIKDIIGSDDSRAYRPVHGSPIRKVKTGKADSSNLPGMVLTTGTICENIIPIALAMLVLSDKSRKLWRNIIMSKDEYLITDAPLKALTVLQCR